MAEIRQSFGLEPDRRTLLVTGASQGARTVNEVMMRLAGPVASAGWQVLHLSGSADRRRVARAYAEAGTRGVIHSFTDRMAEAMFAADLIASRAGASTLAEIQALGRPAMLLPYPYHRDRHQWHNGAVLVEAGAAVMLEDLKDASATARRMEPVLAALMTDDARRQKMARAARRLGRPEAADRIADRLGEGAGFASPRACEISRDQAVDIFSPGPA
jgi:UDP-N-acetylglucosamine--N-acetylmuramyl-(pentapeptide) pyrophosphoryl-undecaprenol N-acetylglucosamine transferase